MPISFKLLLQPYCSKVLALSFLCACIFAACSPKTAHMSDFQEGRRNARSLLDTYGEIEVPAEGSYLRYLAERVQHGVQKVRDDTPPMSFRILNTGKPMAFSAGGGLILFSRGLVTLFQNEAEFAFALCHELAHEVLEHNTEAIHGHGVIEPTRRRELELEADKLAIGLAAYAGYDPRYALRAVARVYGAQNENTDLAGYPDRNSRLFAMQEQVLASGWQPPGTVDRREYQKFRLSLRQ